MIFWRSSVSWKRQCDSEVKALGVRSSFGPWHCCFSGKELASHLISLCLDFLIYKTGMIVSALPPHRPLWGSICTYNKCSFVLLSYMRWSLISPKGPHSSQKHTSKKHTFKTGRLPGFYKLYVKTLCTVLGTQ